MKVTKITITTPFDSLDNSGNYTDNQNIAIANAYGIIAERELSKEFACDDVDVNVDMESSLSKVNVDTDGNDDNYNEYQEKESYTMAVEDFTGDNWIDWIGEAIARI